MAAEAMTNDVNGAESGGESHNNDVIETFLEVPQLTNGGVFHYSTPALSTTESVHFNFQPLAIHVYRNGVEYDQGVTMYVTRREFKHWITFLDALTKKLKAHRPIRKLFTIDGRPVTQFEDLVHKAQYVAVEVGSFIPIDYGMNMKEKGWSVSLKLEEPPPQFLDSAESIDIYLKKEGYGSITGLPYPLCRVVKTHSPLGHYSNFYSSPRRNGKSLPNLSTLSETKYEAWDEVPGSPTPKGDVIPGPSTNGEKSPKAPAVEPIKKVEEKTLKVETPKPPENHFGSGNWQPERERFRTPTSTSNKKPDDGPSSSSEVENLDVPSFREDIATRESRRRVATQQPAKRVASVPKVVKKTPPTTIVPVTTKPIPRGRKPTTRPKPREDEVRPPTKQEEEEFYRKLDEFIPSWLEDSRGVYGSDGTYTLSPISPVMGFFSPPVTPPFSRTDLKRATSEELLAEIRQLEEDLKFKRFGEDEEDLLERHISWLENRYRSLHFDPFFDPDLH